MRVVVAIPTIAVRPGQAEATAQAWIERTPEADVECVISYAGETWAAGLNDVYEQVRDTDVDVLACGSDDMWPADERWLPAALLWLEQGYYPAPRVDDPRFRNYGGFPHPVADGTPGDMSTFPILRGDWLDLVFPLPADLHYFSDNFAAARLLRAGVETVAVPSCRIIHLHAQEGRGAGYGSENTRLYIDTVRYTRALAAEGIDRASLPAGIRGGMWEPHFQELGTLAGA